MQFFLVSAFALLLVFSGTASDLNGKAPIYLGMNHSPQTILLGASPHVFSIQPERAGPLLLSNDSGFRFTPYPYSANYSALNSLNVSEYHVPSIVEFLREDVVPTGINYSYHVPSLGNFTRPDWSPTSDIQYYHVPAITNFLQSDWQPPIPELSDHPTWIYQFLSA
jgi:hypothetical protein